MHNFIIGTCSSSPIDDNAICRMTHNNQIANMWALAELLRKQKEKP